MRAARRCLIGGTWQSSTGMSGPLSLAPALLSPDGGMPARCALLKHSLLTNPVQCITLSLARLLVYTLPPLAFRVVHHSREHAPRVVPCGLCGPPRRNSSGLPPAAGQRNATALNPAAVGPF